MLYQNLLKIKKLKSKLYNILSYILPATLAIIFILFTISLVSTFSSAKSLPVYISNEGFDNLFKLYSSTIQLGAALLAVIVITLTLERMRQTKEQIDIVSSNNRFTNFHYHLDKFVEEISKDKVIARLDKQNLVDKELLVKNLYFQFYYDSYENFLPVFNQDVRKQIKYIKALLDSIDAIPVYKMSDFAEEQLLNFISNLEENKFIKIIRQFTDEIVESFHNVIDKTRVKAALYMYFSIHFYKIVLFREGENINFVREFEYLNYSGKVMNIASEYLLNSGIDSRKGVWKV